MDEEGARKLEGLESDFDNDRAEMFLGLYLGDRVINSLDLLSKSFYDFDLDTEKGIERLLTLLPVLDPEILLQIVHEIWPGYPPDNFEADRFRLELRGYLLDYLDGKEEAQSE